jgi:predicted nucleic acid-binding protein
LILSSEVVVEYLRRGGKLAALTTVPLRDIAVSALTFSWILAEAENSHLQAIDRSRWRTTIIRFRDVLRAGGGDIPALSAEAIQAWGQIHLLHLHHTDPATGIISEMPTEDRLVVAIAIASGYIYVTHHRDWNSTLEEQMKLPLQII